MTKPENKTDAIRIAIEAAILRVALESVARRGEMDNSIFSPAHMAAMEAKKIMNLMETINDKR